MLDDDAQCCSSSRKQSSSGEIPRNPCRLGRGALSSRGEQTPRRAVAIPELERWSLRRRRTRADTVCSVRQPGCTPRVNASPHGGRYWIRWRNQTLHRERTSTRAVGTEIDGCCRSSRGVPVRPVVERSSETSTRVRRRSSVRSVKRREYRCGRRRPEPVAITARIATANWGSRGRRRVRRR